jgi:predicted 3-demethylubiquinone-9 3-methyltransferase (glyoxalase superfamily)
MKPTITTFLMFEGKAEEAMTFYMSLFDDSKVIAIERYGPDGPGKEGSVVHATFTLAGQQLMCIDSPVKHGFTFTPSTSLFVECNSAGEVDRLFEKLSAGGSVMMPLDSYPFSARFAWIADRFGVSWQISVRLKK